MRCPACGGLVVHDYRRGEAVCTRCGLVVAEFVPDVGPEWSDPEGARVGAPLRHPEKPLVTDVGWTDAKGAPVDPRQVRLVKKRQKQTSTPWPLRLAEKTRVEAAKIAAALGLPWSCVEQAVELVRLAAIREEAEPVLSRRPKNVVAAAALFLACKMLKIPRHFRLFADALAGNARKGVGAVYRLLVRTLGLKLAPDPVLYVREIAAYLGLGPEVAKEAAAILRRLPPLSGRNPAVLAAAAVLVAAERAGRPVSADLVAKAAGVSKSSVVGVVKKLKKLAF